MNASNSDNGSNNPSQNNSAENEQRKKGKGRQKITMAKIENEANLQVTFSKRRAGVFKKASELSTLCGAESAVVVFSPGNKPHSFGHPNVETVANRLLHPTGGDPPARTNTAERLIMAHSGAAMHQRTQELVALEAELEREKRRKKELDGLFSGGHLTAPPQLEGLGYEQLERLRKSVVGFKREFEDKVKIRGAASSSGWNGGDGAAAAGGGSLAVAAAVGSSYGYGYGGNNGGGNASSSSSYGLPLDPSYGYMVQYPGVGMVGAYNYGDPSAVVPYDVGTGSSDADAEGGREAARADERRRFNGFGNNYRRPQF